MKMQGYDNKWFLKHSSYQWAILYSKDPSRFWLEITSPRKRPITCLEKALIHRRILAHQRTWQWTIFHSKGPSRFWFKIRSPQKGPITMPRNALIFFAILANRSPRRLDQSANCTGLYKVSPWLWEVVGVQSQGSSSFKRISALKNSSSSQRISLLNSL